MCCLTFQVAGILYDLLRCARPRKFAQNNWLLWHRAFAFSGLFQGIHQLLCSKMVPLALQQAPKAPNIPDDQAEVPAVAQDLVEGHDNAADCLEGLDAQQVEGDEAAAYRKAQSENKRKTADFIGLPHLYDELVIMMQCLQS